MRQLVIPCTKGGRKESDLFLSLPGSLNVIRLAELLLRQLFAELVHLSIRCRSWDGKAM